MLESDGMANVITGTGNETEKPKLCANNQTGGFADFLADNLHNSVENAPTADEKASQEVKK